jgi:hypothetical protein
MEIAKVKWDNSIVTIVLSMVARGREDIMTVKSAKNNTHGRQDKTNKGNTGLHTSAQQAPLVKARCSIKRGFIKTPLHNFVTPTYAV